MFRHFTISDMESNFILNEYFEHSYDKQIISLLFCYNSFNEFIPSLNHTYFDSEQQQKIDLFYIQKDEQQKFKVQNIKYEPFYYLIEENYTSIQKYI